MGTRPTAVKIDSQTSPSSVDSLEPIREVALHGDPLASACNRTGRGAMAHPCLLYTSDAADDLLCVDLGGRRIIKKKKQITKNDEKDNIILTVPHIPHRHNT